MDKFCCNCGSNSCGYGYTVRMASDELLKTKEQYNLIWETLVSLGLSRRETRDEIVNILCWNCCIALQNAEGEKIILPEFDDVFPDDESCKWFERFLEKDKTDIKLPKRYYNATRYKNRYIPCLRVLDIASKIIDSERFS